MTSDHTFAYSLLRNSLIVILLCFARPAFAQVTLAAGDEDGFASQNDPADMTWRRPDFDSAIRYELNNFENHDMEPREFDVGGTGWVFGQTLDGIPINEIDLNQPVTLEIRLRAEGDDPSNDFLVLQYFGPEVNEPGLFYKDTAWSDTIAALNNETWSTGDDVTFVIDLRTLIAERGDNIGDSLAEIINATGHLDIAVQDDTAVDYVQLTYVPRCTVDNGPPVGCLCLPVSQYSPLPEGRFYAEAADDFTINNQTESSVIERVTFYVKVFESLDPSPDSRYACSDGKNIGPAEIDSLEGVRVTVYRDFVDIGGSPPNTPLGGPLPNGEHFGEFFETSVPVGLLTLTPMPMLGGIWRVEVPTNLVVPSNEKLWIAIAPQIQFPIQTALVLSELNPGKPAEQLFAELDIVWDYIDGSNNCPKGKHAENIAFELRCNPYVPQPPYCPCDCDGSNDGIVNILDLLQLVSEWKTEGPCDTDGGGVGTTDLLACLAAWGPCPANENDECAEAGLLSEGENGIDMKGSSASDPDPACVAPGGDSWYRYTCDEPTRITIAATLEVFVEVYSKCNGTLFDCGPAQESLGPFGLCGPGPDGVFGTSDDEPSEILIRLINDQNLPNDEGLKGILFVNTLPVLDGSTCATAIELEAGDCTMGDTTNAIDSLSQDCGDAFDFDLPSHWYLVEGDGTTWTASTCNAGTDSLFDTQLSVFCGDCDTAINCVAGNDNDFNVDCGNGGVGVQSTVSFCTTPGVTYFIVIHGGFGAFPTGAYELCVTSDGRVCGDAAPCPP